MYLLYLNVNQNLSVSNKKKLERNIKKYYVEKLMKLYFLSAIYKNIINLKC